MTFGLTRGEIILVVFIFALIYVAGLLPKIVARLVSSGPPESSAEESGGD